MKWLLCLVLLLAGCTSEVTREPRARASGPKALPLKLMDPTGEVREFVPGAKFEVTVIAFFSPTWNPDNESQVGELQKLHQRRGSQPLRILLVAYDEEPERLRKYLQAQPLPMEVAVGDDATYDSWGLKAIPTTVLVAPDGGTIERLEGQVTAERLWEKISPFFPE